MGPVAVLDPPADCALMREEIFGPLPPIVPYDGGVESAMAAVNDCMLHQPQHGLPFGGVGLSGIGAYHGRHGFERFSHLKGVYLQHPLVGAIFDRWVRPPYGAWTQRLLRWMLRR